MKKSTLLLLLLLLAACQATPTVVVPTLAVLPTMTPSVTIPPSDVPTTAPLPTETPTQADTATLTETPLPTLTFTPLPTNTPIPSATLTLTPSDTPTDTPTPLPTFTLTPSLTITNTITPTASPTFTASPELDSLGMLALLSERATILPPDVLYNPPTLTAVAYAAQTLVAIGAGLTPSPAPAVATTIPGEPQLATLPPPLTTSTCTVPPPGSLGTAFAGDPSLTQAIGCPQGAAFTTTTAVESFEHGSMLYVAGSLSSIYVLTLDGRFRRFDDTWVSGVDPESGGETPPLGLLEPRRGFGKVWRNNLDVRGSLGWAVTDEQGATSSVQNFDRGRAIFLPQRSETELLIDDPGGQSGSWRSLPGGF